MTQEMLLEASLKIKELYSSSHVILFGSTADGTRNQDSDIDLCVIIENPEKRPLEISRQIRKELYPILKSSLDLLVYEKSVFDDRASFPLSLEADILNSGHEI